MKTSVVFLAAALVLAAAAQPLKGDTDIHWVDIAGTLMPTDGFCPQANYILWSACPPSAPQFYLQLPDGKNVDRYLGRLVGVRGTYLPGAGCSMPLFSVARVTDDPLKIPIPPCPPPQCNPGDPGCP